MTFTAIDFETAHAQFPCEIGLSRVENGVVVRSESWLIKPACFPYMNPWNQRVHGISSSDLVNAPTFEELWPIISDYLQDQIVVAHNASFDMGVLRASLAYYDLAVPWVDYFCSVSLSRKAWKQLPSHSLGALCEFHNIKFQHHRAGDDARACAVITLKAFDAFEANDLNQAISLAGIKLKRLLK